MNEEDVKTSFEKLDDSVDELKEVIEEFLDDFLTKINEWWETGKDNIPKASDLVEKLRNKLNQ